MNELNLNIEQAKLRLQQAWWSGVDAVNGFTLVSAALEKGEYEKITHVLAIGKAASSMMLAVEDSFQGKTNGLMVTKYSHVDAQLKDSTSVRIIESGHPRPDDNSLMAGQCAFEFIEGLKPTDHLLMLVSGGASSLAEKLNSDMTLEQLQQLNDDMLSTKKTIAQINAVRSELSQIKNSKLLNRCQAGSITTFAISDVQGDDISVIGSGIGACELEHYKMRVLGSNKVARDAICHNLEEKNIHVICNQESLYGDVYEIAKRLADRLIQGSKGAYVLGGEPIVSLPENPGIGGRNQALALAVAKHLLGHENIVVLVAGSDGTDGPTNAAGGLVDGFTSTEHQTAQQALDKANAGHFLESAGALFVSGPTGTNVMDLLVAIKF